MHIIVYIQMYICHGCAVVETWRSIPVTSYGSDERQVSADGNPRSEIITSLDMLIKLVGLNKTSKTKVQSSDSFVWYKPYNINWIQINIVWNNNRIVKKLPMYSLNIIFVVFENARNMVLEHDESIQTILYWCIKLFSGLKLDKRYFRVCNEQTIFSIFQTVDTLLI